MCSYYDTHLFSVETSPAALAMEIPRAVLGAAREAPPRPTLTDPQSWVCGTLVPVGMMVWVVVVNQQIKFVRGEKRARRNPNSGLSAVVASRPHTTCFSEKANEEV